MLTQAIVAGVLVAGAGVAWLAAVPTKSGAG